MSQSTTVAPLPHDPKVATEPSGPRGDNPATAGTGNTAVISVTPENKQGALDPSAPGNTGTTPGSVGQKGDSDQGGVVS